MNFRFLPVCAALLVISLTLGGQDAPAAGEDGAPFISLRSYIAKETMGPPENMAYVAARCAALNMMSAAMMHLQLDAESIKLFKQRAMDWIRAGAKMQAEAHDLSAESQEALDRVMDEVEQSREGYFTNLVESVRPDTPEARLLESDRNVCSYLYDGFNLGG